MTFEFLGLEDYLKENPMRDLDNIISNGNVRKRNEQEKKFSCHIVCNEFLSHDFL